MRWARCTDLNHLTGNRFNRHNKFALDNINDDVYNKIIRVR